MTSKENLLDERMDKDLDLGYKLGEGVIDELMFEAKDNPSREHFVGILSCFLGCMYYTQSENACIDVIEFCKKVATDQLQEFKENGT